MTTTLLLGCDVRPPSHAPSPAHPLSIDTPFGQIQNDDGICIFDMTEIGRPRYAMPRCVENPPCDRHDGICRSRNIMNASDYIRRCRVDEIYDDANGDSDGLGCSDHGPARGIPVAEYFPDEVRELDAFPLVRCWDLGSVWPQGGGFGAVSLPFDGEGKASKRVSEEFHGSNRHIPRSKIESLGKLIGNGVKSGGLSWLEEVEGEPRFPEALHAYVLASPEDLRDEHLCTLLERAHRGCTTVDLSPFCNLSLDKVVTIVNELSDDPNQKLRLTLPDLEDVTGEFLQRLIASDSIAELSVGKHDTIDLNDIVSTIDGTGITSLTTPELYSRRFVSSNDSNQTRVLSAQGIRPKL